MKQHNNDIEKMAASTSWRCRRKYYDTFVTKTNIYTQKSFPPRPSVFDCMCACRFFKCC